MESKPTKTIKLLLTGAFIALATSVFGQSITAEHYEASGTQTYLMPAPFFASNIRICAQDSVKLTASSFSGNSFTWTLPDGSTSSVTASSIWVKDQGNYSVSDGTSSATLYVAKESGKPEIYSSSYPVTEELLQAAGSDSNKINPGTLFSFFSSSSKQDFIAPVGKEFTYTKQQYLITSSELTAMGFTQGSIIKSLGFYFNNSWSGCNSNGFNLRINLYPTTLSSMSSSFITSGGHYIGDYGCDSYNAGWNYFDFSNTYTWDGTSDLVFDFSYYNENGSTDNPSIAIDQTTFAATTISISPNVDLRYNWPSSAFVKSAGNYRPSLSFKYSRPALKDTIVSCSSTIQLDVKNGSGSNTYTWASTGGLSSSTSNLTVSNSDLVYLSSVSSNLCLVKDTVQVLKSTVTAPVITASSADFCEGETVTLSTTIPTNYTASWSNASNSSSIAVSSGGDYTVSLINEYGCSKTSAKKTITEIKKPVLLKSSGYVDVYANQDLSLVSGSGSRTAKYFGDYAGSKYFIFRNGQDSASYADLVESAPGAEMVAINNQGLDQWVISTHNDLYNISSSDYPYTLQTGVKWDESEQELKGIDGITQTYESWYNDPYTSLSQDKWFVRYYQNNTYLTWWDTDNFDNGGALIRYPIANLTVQNGEVFCDSVELFAPADFTSFLWSTGETTESIWVSGLGSHSISLTGTYVKSDGSSCSLTSDTYTFTINPSPSLSITNNSGTVDLDGTNYIDLEADYTTGASILWSTGSTTDTINAYSSGDYTVTATLNGCSTTESIEVYQPLYVAKTGSDGTGDGSFSNPFLTIQKGIDEASEGQKIYVLPGTYEEGQLDFETSSGSGVYKSVFIASDLVRLNDSSAISSTVIDADGDQYLINIYGSNTSTIQGFTLTGQEAGSDWESSVLRLQNGASLTFRDLIIRDNNSVNNSREAQVMNIRHQGTNIVFDNVHFKDNGDLNDRSRKTAFIYNYASAQFINCTWEGNYCNESVVRVQYYATVYFENNLFLDNYATDWGIVDVGHDSYSKATLINSSIVNNLDLNSNRGLIGISGNNNTVEFFNSVLGNPISGQYMIKNNSSTSNSFVARNSVLSKDTVDGATYADKLNWDVDGSNVFADPQLNSDGTLKSNSPAIGLGSSQPFVFGGVTYTPPTTDLAGVTRPDPAGSSPDAGAYESDKAQGDFDILLSQCGYLLDATVLNSNAYSVAWMFNGDTVSTSGSFTASALGTYTAYVESTDRSSTLSETISLSDPLRFVMMGTKNNCTDVGSSNGYIRWGQPEGGTANNNNNYYSWVQNSSGSYQWGNANTEINRKADNNGYHETNSLGAGMYYVSVSDATGCTITDTIEIIDQDQDTYFVSTTGSDSNNGTSTNDAWGSIEYAISQVCDEDTIIVLDGTYYEDSLDVTRDLVLGSMYLIDGDTNHIANTVIDGEDDGWIMRWQAGNGNWSDTTSNQLVGLTIQNGSSTNSNYAGGLTVYNTSVLKVKNVKFTNNDNSQGSGGAMRARSAYLEIEHVDFVSNSANQAGGLYTNYGRLRMKDVLFDQNASVGSSVSAIFVNRSYEFETHDITVRNHQNLTQDHVAYLYLNDLSSDAVLESWRVTNNAARSKLFWLSQPESNRKLTIENSLIAGNTTERGAPGLRIQNTRNEVVIVNTTVAGNTSITESNKISSAPISFRNLYDTPTISILNSVVDNTTSLYSISERHDNGVDLHIENSFVDGGASSVYVGSTNSTLTYGTSNLSSGLYFTDAANGDYSLSSVSTLLGAGVSSATVGGISITAPTTDLYGNPRPNPAGTNPDMGAIEGVDSIAQIGIATVVTNNGFCETASGAITANLLNYTGTATYSWSSSTYPTWTWNSTQSATSLASGDYKVVALDATDGSKIDSMEVTVVTLPSISIANTSTDVTCFGDDDGELTFEISGGNPLGGSQYNYSVDYLQSLAQATGVVLPSNGSWFNDDNYSNSRTNKYNADDWNGNPIYQGKYYVSVSDQDGCTYTDTVVVGYDHELPQVNITTLASDGTVGLTSMCEGTGNTINLTANVTGGGGTNTFSWSNASTAQTVGVAQTGDYYVEVTDQYTCVGKDTIDIYFQSAPQLVLEGAGTPAYSGQPLTGTYASNSAYMGSYEGSHYYFINAWEQWETARAYAESLGGHLARPESEGEADALHQMKQQNDCCTGVYIDIHWNNNRWEYSNGQAISFNYFNGNYQLGQGTNNGTSTSNHVEINGTYWNHLWYTDTRPFIIEFDPVDAPVVFNQAFCDSIELKATPFVSTDGNGFTEIYWTDAQNDTINELEYKTFYADQDITLHGVFTRSDGETCDLSSITYSFDVFSSPNLVITNYSGSVDLLGGDTIVLVASTDAGTVSWVDSAGTITNNDTLLVTSPGIYTAKANTTTCSSEETIDIYQPLYVAKTGSDATGDGSFSNPFLTIQKGIDEASEGHKIYVLPGTYVEGELDFEVSSGVYKSVYLASDYVRLGDSSAIASTVIDADDEEWLINIYGENHSTIQGFTLTGQLGGSSWESSVLRLFGGASLTFKDLVISGNEEGPNNNSEAHVMNVRYNSSPLFENVTFRNNGSVNNFAAHIVFVHSNANATFRNCLFENNYGWQDLVKVNNSSSILFENTLFKENYGRDWGLLFIDGSDSRMTLMNSTIYKNSASSEYLFGISGSNHDLLIINSVINSTGSPSKQIRNNTSTSNTLIARNSVLPYGTSGATYADKLNWDVDGSNVFADPQLNSDGTLKSNSPAIGLGSSQPFVFGGVTYTPPTTDLAGVTRPDPAGSSPDAGAYESDKAQGDFDILLSQCGYLLDATVLNSNAYSVAWMFNGDTVSTSGSFTASALGTYTAYVESTDRSSTLSETISLSDPLRFVMMGTKNNCTDVGSSNGYIRWGQPEGGTANNNNNYYSWVQNSSGSYQWGNANTEINRKADNNGYHETNSLGAGMYYVSVSDATGCTITDTIEIIDQDQDTYFVSTTGSDSNNGTSTNDAWGSIEYAISQVCDEDTIIVLDGTYYEDSLDVTRDLVLGSMYLIDGDTNHIANTIIDGEDDGWIMRWQAGNGNWSDTTSNQLVGLTIQNGHANQGSGYSGGLSVWNNRVVKVSRVTFKSNHSSVHHGGGMYTHSNSYVELDDVLFRENSADGGGAIMSQYSRMRWLDVEFDNNQTTNNDGLAIWIDNSYSFYSDGVYIHDHTNSQGREVVRMNMWDISEDATLKNWRVQNNTVNARVFSISQQNSSKKLIIENALISDNTSTNGGPGLVIRDSRNDVNIVNSTIANNTSITKSNNTGASMLVIKNAQSDLKVNLLNSIVQNTSSLYTIAENGGNGFEINIENSFVDGGTSKVEVGSNTTKSYGTSNLSSGLYFTDAANGDYSLSSVSTLLGAGVSSATVGGISITAPTTDLYGNPRPNPAGTNPDMGAIEGVDSIAQIGIATVVTNNGFCETASGAITANLLNYTGTATYSWSSSTYPTWTWNSTQSATSLASGDYKVVALDATDGSKIDSMEVTVVTLPSISIANTSTDVTCFGDDDGELTFEISGGNPLGGSQYNYSVDYLQSLAQATGVVLPSNGSWFNDDNYSNSRTNKYNADDWNGNPIYQGKYYVSVSDQDGCTYTDTVVVGYDHELPQVNITTLASDGTVGLTSMCEGTGNTINLTANVTGGGGTNTFSWSNASTAQTVGVAQTGDYYVEVTDQYTCVGKDTIDIYFQSAPQLVIEDGAPALYSGQAITGTYANNATYLGEYEDHHYYSIRNWESWPSARSIAESLGGSLFIPNSYAEGEAIDDFIEDENIREEYWIGVYWNGTDWVDVNDEALSFTYWWGSTTNTSPYDTPYSNYPYARKSYWSSDWYNTWSNDTRPFIVEFERQDAPVVYNQAFCDSVELKATPLATSDSPGFTEIYWTDAVTGDSLNSGSYGVFGNSQEVILKGVFTRSDGTTCEISSSTYKFGVFESPSLTFTTYDSLNNQYFNGSNILACAETELYTTVSANSDTSNSFTYNWSSGESDSIISTDMWTAGTVEVTDVLGCSTTDSLTIFKKSEPTISKSVINTDTSMAYYGAPYIPNFYYQGQIGNNYIYASSYSATWSQARQDALALGGDLASFSTESEYNTLTSWSWNDRFVGLNDSVTEGVWQFSDGTPVTYLPPSWGQGEPNNAGNEDYITISNYNFNDIGENSQYEFFLQIPVPPTEVPLLSGEAFCDSVTLIASETATEDSTTRFSRVYWKDASNGAVIDSSETLKVTNSTNLYLEGYFDQSNGIECSIIGDTINVIINETPDLTVYSADSTFELTTDTMNLIAFSNVTGASITWQVDTSIILSDTLAVYERGLYTAKASLNGCSVSEEVFVDRPLFVAKTGSNITGTGSLDNPYKTIQFAIDTASSGQKIYVLPGTYNENLVIDKQVRLYSDYARLGNAGAISGTVINAGFNGRVIEFSSSTRLDKDSTIIDGFTIKNGDVNGNEGSGIYASWNQGSGITINNSIISYNRKQCCSDGIAIALHGVDLYLNNVDISNNGSLLYWDERSTITLRNLKSVWNNVRFRSNEANNSLVYLYDTDLQIHNSDFIGNTVHDNNESVIHVDWGSDLLLNHVTMTNNFGQGFAIKVGNNDDAKVVLHNTLIDGFTQGGIKTAGASNQIYLVNSIVNNIPASISGNASITKSNSLEIPTLGIKLDGSLQSTSPAIGLGNANDTTIAGYSITVPRFDLSGNQRPIPAGSNPDAGAYEDSLSVGDFGLEVQNCGYAITSTVLNSTNYSVTVTGVGGFSQTGEEVIVALKGTYLVTAVDSISGEVLTQSVAITNPLTIDYLWSRDACASNGGYGEIVMGDFSGGVHYNVPGNNWYDYELFVNDSVGNNITHWYAEENNWSRYNTNVTSGKYVVQLSDASGCSVYDTVIIEDVLGSKYYVSTTGSDASSGVYSDPLSTIQEAMNRACDGDTIVLFDGEYFENVEYTSSSLPYVTIASEYIENGVKSHIANTIVNGMDEDPVFDISNHNSTTDTVKFVGFTITNGKSSNWYGGGGISSHYSNVALKHMVVSGNRSGHAGGGIGFDGGHLNLWHTEISNNIADNEGGGIRANHMERLDGHGSTVIKNNKTNSNGGGISYGHWHWDSNEDFYIKGFTIENNSANSEGGGLHINNWGNNNGELLIENIKILNNRSIYNNSGGMYISHNGEDAVMKNVIIANNRSNNTGGLKINDVDLHIVHSTIYANSVLDGTSSNDQIELQNNANVLFLNSAVGGQVQVGNSVPHTFYLQDYDTTCDLTIANSIVQGGINSIDNPYSSTVSGTPIGQPLYLANPSQGDYMLSPVSQGLGAAASFYTGITMPYLDIEGMTRPNPVGSNPDVGAVESPLDSAEFGAAYEIRNNIACDPTYGRLKVTPLNGSGSYKYELDDLTGTATFADQQNVSSYTYSSLYSGDYLVTITDLFDSSVFTDTITVSGKDSLNVILDYNDEFCAGANDGAISIQVTGGDGYYDYTWSTLTNSNFPKSKNLNNLSPDEYFVTVKDGDNCFIEDSVTINTLHQLPAVAITGNIDKGGLITQTTNPIVRACAGDLVSLDAGAGFFSYNWSTEDQLNSWTTQTLSASYEESFYVTVVDSFGCSNVDSVEVFYVQRPAIFASNVNTNIGGTYQQVTSYVEGSNQYTGFGNEPKPYGANDRFAKMQFIIPANELIAEGLTDQTTINSLGFEVDLASGSPVQNFKIKLKNTTANQLSSTFETGLTEVYDFNILTAGDGWNTHEFDQGFVWDGTKNLLVQVEYSNVAFNNASNTYLIGHSTSYTSSSVATNYSSSVANQNSADNTYSWRPNMKLGIDKVQATDTLRVCDFTMLNTTDDYDTYSWLINGTSVGTQLRYSLATPQEVVLQTVDAASSCTMYSDTVQVLLDTTPTVFVTSNSLIGCVGDSVIAQVDTVKNNIQYLWSNGVNDTTAAFVESGTYYVYAVSPSGCQGVDTVNVDINIPPDLVIELNGRVLTATDGSLITNTSSCDTTLLLPYSSTVDTLSELNASEWTSYSSQFLEWEFNQGWDSLVDYTGPQYDADSNFHGGFYQFDPASITDQGKTGYLQLGCVNLVGMSDPAIEFAYHMVDVYADSSNTSDQMGTLTFEVKESSDDSWTTLWQRSGTDQSYGWVNKVINLSGFVNQTVQMRWKATAGVGGPRTEMAIDNISITDSLATLSNISGRLTPETVCEGDSLYARTIGDSSSTFTYLWTNGETDGTIALTQTGWYGVSVIDGQGCEIVSDSVFIEVNPAPNNMLVLSDTTQYCFGQFDSLTISAVPGYTSYDWNINEMNTGTVASSCQLGLIFTDSYGDGWNGATAQVKDANGTVITTIGSNFTSGSLYNDTITLPGGAAYTIEVSNVGSYVYEIGLIVILNGDTLASYSNNSLTTLGTVMASFTPNCGNQFTSTHNQVTGTSMLLIDSISTGTTGYYVTITDSIGCRANSDVVNLIQRDNPALQFVSNALLCNDDSTGSIDLTVVGNGGHQFDWSTGDSTQGISNLYAGWYTVAVTDSFSCSTVDSVEVVEPTPVVLTQVSTSDVLCFGGSDGYANYTFSGGVGGYTYAWTDSSGTWSSDSLSLANAPIGTYYLNAQDSNGCSLVDTVSIDQPSELILTLDSTVNLSCYQSADGQAFASVVGGFGSYTYRLDGNVVSTLSDTALNAGTHTYTVTDDNGCTDSVSFVLTEPQLLTASTVVSQYLGGIQISCNGANDGSIDVTVNGGTLPYSYSWTDGDTTEDRSLLVAGTYSMTVQDAQGCEVSVNEVLLEPTQVQMISVVTDLDCYGATDAEVNYTVSGGTAPYSTSWSGSAGTGVDSVYVTFQVDMQGASINTGGIQVVSNSGLNLPMNIVPVLEDSIYRVTTQVSAGSTIQYRFFNGSTAETVPTSCGVNVSGTFYREVQVLSDTTIAARAFSSCTVSAPGLSGAMITGARTLTGLGAGIYTMSMADVNGCTVVLTDTIVSPDSLYISSVSIVDASCPQTPDGFIDISAAGGTAPYTFSWSSGDTTEDITAAYGYYDLVVTDDKGCTDSSTYLIDAPFPYNDEEICVVTVDSTGVNMLVWEKTPGQKTASYEIFRENASTQFVSVGTNQYNDMSTWADQNSNPAVQPYRYKIAVVDSCGNYSDTSDYHATIHLQASQGVAANEVNLQWTAYEGKQVQTYYIYRWLSPINRILIDSVSSSVQTYTDIYPVNTTITALLYEVGAKFTNGGCSPSAGKQSSYVTSMSNQLDWGQDGGLPIGTEEWVDVVLESDLLIYPNPTRSYVNLELSGAWADQKDIRIKFTDMTGRIMAQKVVQGDGKHQFDFRELPAGIYFVQIITAEGRTIVHRFEKVN